MKCPTCNSVKYHMEVFTMASTLVKIVTDKMSCNKD